MSALERFGFTIVVHDGDRGLSGDERRAGKVERELKKAL
jgi:hypothetical protein